MKKLLLLLSLMLPTFIASAQSSQMATLLHDGIISNYYSATALKEALDAAEDGDVISLSSGVFQAADITKNVAIRGVGITVKDFNENEIPTALTGDFKIDTPLSEIHHLSLEGIYHNGTIQCRQADGFTANKCEFGKFQYYYTTGDKSRWNDFKFLHCVFTEFYFDTFGLEGCSVNFINCVLKLIPLNSRRECVTQFTNCILYTEATVKYAMIVNSIIVMNRKSAIHATVEANSTLNKCIVFNCTQFQANPQGNTIINNSETGIFKDNSFYQLVDEYKTYKGVDGSELGIHGGNLPFTPVTSRPHITKFNVASKTTADGKLSVDIEIAGED